MINLPKDTPLYVLADIAEEEGREEDALPLHFLSCVGRRQPVWIENNGYSVECWEMTQVESYDLPGTLVCCISNSTWYRHGGNYPGWTYGNYETKATSEQIQTALYLLRKALEKLRDGNRV